MSNKYLEKIAKAIDPKVGDGEVPKSVARGAISGAGRGALAAVGVFAGAKLLGRGALSLAKNIAKKGTGAVHNKRVSDLISNGRTLKNLGTKDLRGLLPDAVAAGAVVGGIHTHGQNKGYEMAKKAAFDTLLANGIEFDDAVDMFKEAGLLGTIANVGKAVVSDAKALPSALKYAKNTGTLGTSAKILASNKAVQAGGALVAGGLAAKTMSRSDKD